MVFKFAIREMKKTYSGVQKGFKLDLDVFYILSLFQMRTFHFSLFTALIYG